MTRIGLISNVCSERNKRGMEAVDRTVAGLAGVRHEKICAVDGLVDILASFAADDVRVIAINSGDGTIHAVLTVLLEQRPFAEIPPVCVLMGGMANMTGADVAPRGKAPAVLRRLKALVETEAIDRHLIRRNVLRLENIVDEPPQRAMFFGAAGIVEAIRLCKSEMHSRGLSATWANWATLLKMLGRWAVSGEGGRHDLGAELDVALDDAPAAPGRRLLLLATTLDRLILGSRPFWNTGGGPVRYTEIAYPVHRLLLNAPNVLYGRSDRSVRGDSFRSRGVHRVSLAMDGPFTLDGQFFTAERARPLVITAEDRVAFVKF